MGREEAGKEIAAQQNIKTMDIYYDIETVPKPSNEIDEMMPPEIKSPRMPFELENPSIPDFSTMQHGSLKDPTKIAEWREKKRQEFHEDHRAKIAKWNSEALDKRLKYIDRAALDPGLCNIKLAGFRMDGKSTIFVSELIQWQKEERKQIIALSDELRILEFDGEEEMLIEMWEYMANFITPDSEDRFIGFHSNRFDLPMMKRRSWANKVKVPLPTMRGAYVNGDLFLDLHETWASGDRSIYDSMNKVARSLGIQIEKSGTGEFFDKLWARDKVAALIYNNMDLIITESIADRIL